ncbi:MAG: hypothetical protein H7125_06955 [Proteobacteria bacterium]|nr:hypothetical protein [Burkholderiales bacterium]
MASSNTIDFQKLLTGAARLELKAVLAGMECVQVWINQSAKFSTIVTDTLQSVQDDKGSLSDTARRLTDFGRENAEVFTTLSSKMSQRYFDELGRLTSAVVDKGTGRDENTVRPTQPSAPAKKISRRKMSTKSSSPTSSRSGAGARRPRARAL